MGPDFLRASRAFGKIWAFTVNTQGSDGRVLSGEMEGSNFHY